MEVRKEIKEESPYQKFEDKAVLILTKNQWKYKTQRLQVFPRQNCVSFKDKFGTETIISFSEIQSIVEVRDG